MGIDIHFGLQGTSLLNKSMNKNKNYNNNNNLFIFNSILLFWAGVLVVVLLCTVVVVVVFLDLWIREEDNCWFNPFAECKTISLYFMLKSDSTIA
jgi:hypothetical protein